MSHGNLFESLYFHLLACFHLFAGFGATTRAGWRKRDWARSPLHARTQLWGGQSGPGEQLDVAHSPRLWTGDSSLLLLSFCLFMVKEQM